MLRLLVGGGEGCDFACTRHFKAERICTDTREEERSRRKSFLVNVVRCTLAAFYSPFARRFLRVFVLFVGLLQVF